MAGREKKPNDSTVSAPGRTGSKARPKTGSAANARARELTSQINAFIRGDCGDPFALLGPHLEEPAGIVIRCFHPMATRVWVIDQAGKELAELERWDEAGFFAGPIGVRSRISYRLRIALPEQSIEIE